MKSIQTREICKKFDARSWFYVYQRIDGPGETLEFVKQANKDNWRVISVSVGIKTEDVDLIKTICSLGLRVDYVTVDVALSYTDSIKRIINTIKEKLPNTYLIVGNGATGEWIEFLENLGVDCAKVGIGVSKSCRTRQYTGFGSTTISSLMECAAAAKNIKIMSDGGLTVENGEVWIGDIAKAIRFGADCLMSGSLFSKCVDSPAIIGGYFGNASSTAKGNRTHVEGATLKVETNGLTIEEQMNLIEDSLRSSVSYSGGTKIQDLKNVDYFII
jgi:GMP reductase